VLRRELGALRPASVPDGPTHEALVASSLAGAETADADTAEAGPELEASRR
jgi:hypothetical protein